DLPPYRRWSDPILRQVADDENEEPPRRLRASLALLPTDSRHSEYLKQCLLTASPEEVIVIRDALRTSEVWIAPWLWASLLNDTASSATRLRAACALAALDAGDARWQQARVTVAELLV